MKEKMPSLEFVDGFHVWTVWLTFPLVRLPRRAAEVTEASRRGLPEPMPSAHERQAVAPAEGPGGTGPRNRGLLLRTPP